MFYRYSTAAALFLMVAASVGSAQSTPPQDAGSSSLRVFVQGMPLGSEDVTVTSGPDGWLVKSTGRLGAPINVTVSKFEMRYDADWKPLRLAVEGTLRGQIVMIQTTFAGGLANSDIEQAGQISKKSDKVSADTIVLPNICFGAYEVLALRLATIKPGEEVHAYIAPQMEIPIRLTAVRQERIRTSSRTIAARIYDVTLMNPGSTLAAEIWADEANRLLRFRVAAQGLEVAREDVASVSARVEHMNRADDELVHMPANGFSLAGTLSRPAAPPQPPEAKEGPRLPAVVLVPGSGRVDRDETVSGIPVFAQLANALANAGFVVVRYDKRGLGQSGGRDEAATLEDFADDALAAANYLRKRKDVDPDRVALIGHSEGGLVSLQAAARGKKSIAALVLISTPGSTGAELVLEQQRHALDRMPLTPEERQRRIELQLKIHEAVISGKGWEGIPPTLKQQADSPWFRSMLLFDPAKVMPKVEEPIFIVQAGRDTQVPLHHGQRLMDLGAARKNKGSIDIAIVDGINHLLVPAATGEVSEYPTLTDKTLSPQVIDHVVRWLKSTLPEPAPKLPKKDKKKDEKK
jgi:pimeloyl-ACP methyl ester carboxylesterase